MEANATGSGLEAGCKEVSLWEQGVESWLPEAGQMWPKGATFQRDAATRSGVHQEDCW